jgi:hypothetical protein
MDGVAWCSIWVCWVLAHAGLDPRPRIDGYASCQMAYVGWRRLGRVVPTAHAAHGDIVFLKLGRAGNWTNHTGLVTGAPYRRAGQMVLDTVEGNTDTGGSRTGGRVMARTRPLSVVRAVARPPYTAPQPPQPPQVLPARPAIASGARGRPVEIAQWEIAATTGRQFPAASVGVYDLHLIAAVRDLGRVLGRTWDGVSIGPDQWAAIDFLYVRAGHRPVT